MIRIFFFLATSILFDSCFQLQSRSTDVPKFQKSIIDTTFRSESITSADINQDGTLDIIIGDVWYEAPNWTLHEIRIPGRFTNTTQREGEPESDMPYYSNSFAVQTMDVNKDGWPDVIVYPVMNKPIYWYENPKNEEGLWKERIAANAYHGESPLMVDLVGNLC